MCSRSGRAALTRGHGGRRQQQRVGRAARTTGHSHGRLNPRFNEIGHAFMSPRKTVRVLKNTGRAIMRGQCLLLEEKTSQGSCGRGSSSRERDEGDMGVW